MGRISIDIDDHLEEAGEDALIAELESRGFTVIPDDGLPDQRITGSDIRSILDEAAIKLRSYQELALAFKLDEIRNGVVQP